MEVSKTRAPLLGVPTVRIKASWVEPGGLHFVLKQIGTSSLQEAIHHKQVRFGGAQTQVLKMNVCLSIFCHQNISRSSFHVPIQYDMRHCRIHSLPVS